MILCVVGTLSERIVLSGWKPSESLSDAETAWIAWEPASSVQ
jgi:hypothetical protein